MQLASDTTVLGDFADASLTVGGAASRFFRRDGKFVVQTEGPDGKPADFEILYTFGVAPLQQYLVALPGGRLQALSLAWDARPRPQGGQRWFGLYPGQTLPPGDPLHWTGRNQNWNFMCAECHSTGVAKNYDAASDSYATSWSEVNVACESCHGPASRHVDWATAGRLPRPDKGFAFALHGGEGSWGDFDARGIRRWSGPPRANPSEEVCAPCHSRRRPLVSGAEPSPKFLDTHLPEFLDDGLYFPDGQIQDEVFEWGSFQQSRMHAAGVTCADCHEPHGASLRAPGNALCAQCHDPARFDRAEHHHHASDSAGSQCASCHMPSRTYMQVHVRHDHGFRLPRPDLSEKLGTPNACNACHADKTPRWAVQSLRDWGAASRLGEDRGAETVAAARQGAPGAEKALAALASDERQSVILRATALSLLARAPGEAALNALTSGLRQDSPLLRLGALRGLSPYDPVIREKLGAPLRDDPIRAVRIEAGRLGPDHDSAALDEWIAAERLAEERPETHLNLGALAAERGKAPEAEAEFLEALALEPRLVPALLDLADLYRSLGRDLEAEAPLRRAVAAAPDDADAHYALALWLVRQKRLADARAEVREIARQRPGDARFGELLRLLAR